MNEDDWAGGKFEGKNTEQLSRVQLSEDGLTMTRSDRSNSEHVLVTTERGFDPASSRKYFWEIKVNKGQGTGLMIGVCTEQQSLLAYVGDSEFSWSYNGCAGGKYHGGTPRSFGEFFAKGDVIGVLVDFENEKGTLEFFLNGKSQGIAFDGLKEKLAELKASELFPAASLYDKYDSFSLVIPKATSLKNCCRKWLRS